jgi:nucleotide-binding universal stress UspA family protein
MSLKIIVSYDDTDNDRDALALGRFLAEGGGSLALAYVRHAQQSDSDREALAEKEAHALLEHGANLLGDPDVPRHVIVHASTGDGLRELALREGADIIVFGSDYRTAPGAVVPGTSAKRLLSGGPAAVAIAPANLRDRPAIEIGQIGVYAEDDDSAPRETARSLAARVGGTVVEGDDDLDLLVVGSRAGTQTGRLELSASAEYEIETAGSPVLAVPHGVAIKFPVPATAGV